MSIPSTSTSRRSRETASLKDMDVKGEDQEQEQEQENSQGQSEQPHWEEERVTWLDHQQLFVSYTESDPDPDLDDDDDFEADSDPDTATATATTNAAYRYNKREKTEYNKLQRRLRKKNIADQIIELHCQWSDCVHQTYKYEDYQNHLKKHIDNLNTENNKTKKSLYGCLWQGCGFETQDNNEITRHINFHAYHTRIKAIGDSVCVRFCLEGCTKDSSDANQLPELPADFKCQWVSCSLSFEGIQDFFDHVQCHVAGSDRNPKNKLVCGWIGCQYTCPTQNKMKIHSRRHTKERVVACSRCGTMFATNAMYEDHCVRQAQITPKFKCEICKKFYKSERILRSHVRRHYNSYKCTFCDMTLSAPSALVKHIRYCHLEYRPFQCRYCQYSAVNKCDLQDHHLRHEGLNNKASKKKHPGRKYICQFCEDLFSEGHTLSKHLVRVHGYAQRPGFPRFRYQEAENGLFRLNPYRYDSQQFTNQIIAAENNENQLVSNNLIDDQETDDLKLIEYRSGDNEKPAGFVMLPSNISEKASTAAIIDIKKCAEKSLNKKTGIKTNSDNIKVKPKAKKRHWKFNNKNDGKDNCEPRVKKVKMDVLYRSPESKVCNLKNIEISIADIDEDGHVIKSEIVKAQEIII